MKNRETLGIKYRTKWRERVTKFMGSRFINRKSFEQGGTWESLDKFGIFQISCLNYGSICIQLLRSLRINCTQSVRQLECAHTHLNICVCVCVCAYPRSTLPHSPTKAAVLTYRTFWLLSLSPVWLLHNFIHSVENDNINFVFYLCDSCPGRMNERATTF